MKILLMAMPDAASNFQRIITVPSLGLCSMAGMLRDHRVRVVDLVLVRHRIRRWLTDFLAGFRPDLIGISSMSFQYDSARLVAAICRKAVPAAKIALGGYHATLGGADAALLGGELDFVIRGEGEQPLRALVDLLDGSGGKLSAVPGLSWRDGARVVHNRIGPLLDLQRLPLPDRSARVLDHFRYFGRRLDCVETSRGCTRHCSFCSISGMYGTSFRCFAIDRVIEDLAGLRRSGTEAVLIVDDNITLAPRRFRLLAEAIVRHGLQDMEYLVQASVAGIISDPGLIPALAAANFRLVFLGIESVLPRNLELFRKRDVLSGTELAVGMLRAHGIAVMGGFIVGHPDDTRDDVRAIFKAIRRLKIDLPYVQCVTPYPGTRIRATLLRDGLVTNPARLDRYTGFACNVRTRSMTQRQLNRIVNWENLKLFWDPLRYRDNYFVRHREKGALKVLLNSMEYIAGWFSGNPFRSRHSF